MSYCRNCGNELAENAVFCPNCKIVIAPNHTQPNLVDDNGSFGWGVLGFFVPIAGLILYLVWKDQRPRSAKAAGIGALINVGVELIIGLIYILFLVIVFA